VKTPYEYAYQRLKNRGREGEENIPVELLKKLELKHEDFTKSKYCGVIHVLDGRKSKKDLVADAITKLRQIELGSDSHQREVRML